MTTPTAYIITVVDPCAASHAVAKANLAVTVTALEQWAWPWRVWPATVPSAVDWTGLGVALLPRGAILKRPGAQAVDKQIGSRVVDWRYWCDDLVMHRPAVHRSTTSPKVR